MIADAKADLLRDLREQTQRIAATHRRASQNKPFSTGWDALDRLLPGAGFEGGTLVEWLAEGAGSGALTLALISAVRTLEAGGAGVVIDPRQEFYPPAAAELGLPLDRLILIRPPAPRLALWAWEQALRFRGVAVTLGEWESLDDRPFRRLQLAAEAGGGLGFLVRPIRFRAAPSWAAVRLAVAALPSGELPRRWRVEVVHSGNTIELNAEPRTERVFERSKRPASQRSVSRAG
jgi:hypothetical protein